MNHYKLEELLPIVANLVKEYTSNESTSISYEAAEQLMGAVCYCLNEFEQYKKSSKELFYRGGAPSIACFYQAGYEIVFQRTKEAKLLYDKVLLEFQDYGNLAYYETIVKAIPRFFLYYNPKFRHQDSIITLDYPTLCPIKHQSGIDEIILFLNYIQLEQQFLSRFPKCYVQNVLSYYYNRQEEMFINISQIVLRNIIARKIIDKEERQGQFTQKDFYSKTYKRNTGNRTYETAGKHNTKGI